MELLAMKKDLSNRGEELLRINLESLPKIKLFVLEYMGRTWGQFIEADCAPHKTKKSILINRIIDYIRRDEQKLDYTFKEVVVGCINFDKDNIVQETAIFKHVFQKDVK